MANTGQLCEVRCNGGYFLSASPLSYSQTFVHQLSLDRGNFSTLNHLPSKSLNFLSGQSPNHCLIKPWALGALGAKHWRVRAAGQSL